MIADCSCSSKVDCCVERELCAGLVRCAMAETCVESTCGLEMSSWRTEKRLNVAGEALRHEADIGGLRRGFPQDIV